MFAKKLLYSLVSYSGATPVRFVYRAVFTNFWAQLFVCFAIRGDPMRIWNIQWILFITWGILDMDYIHMDYIHHEAYSKWGKLDKKHIQHKAYSTRSSYPLHPEMAQFRKCFECFDAETSNFESRTFSKPHRSNLQRVARTSKHTVYHQNTAPWSLSGDSMVSKFTKLNLANLKANCIDMLKCIRPKLKETL